MARSCTRAPTGIKAGPQWGPVGQKEPRTPRAWPEAGPARLADLHFYRMTSSGTTNSPKDSPMASISLVTVISLAGAGAVPRRGRRVT
jgi:hypothetical protein